MKSAQELVHTSALILGGIGALLGLYAAHNVEVLPNEPEFITTIIYPILGFGLVYSVVLLANETLMSRGVDSDK